MAIIVSMINWKGGVGKTTLCLHLAAGLVLKKRKVLIIDLDPQCNLSFLSLGLESYVKKVYKDNKKTLKDVFDAYFDSKKIDVNDVVQKQVVKCSPGYVYKDLDIILSHQNLVLLDLKLARSRKAGIDHKEETRYEIEKIAILDSLLSEIKDSYDYILLDCPPNVNLITQNAFFTSNYYVVPAIPDFLSTTGISLIREYMDQFNKDFDSMSKYAEVEKPYLNTAFGGIIFNMVDEYGSVPKQTHNQTIMLTKKQFPDKIFEHYLTDGDGISAASSINIPVYSYSDLPRSSQNGAKQASYLDEIVDEFLARIK